MPNDNKVITTERKGHVEPPVSNQTYWIDNDPSLSRKVDALRQALSVHQIRCVGEHKRDRLRDLNLRDTRERLRVAFAEFLPLDAALPSDAFLDKHAVRLYDAILGTTRAPMKVTK